MPKREKDAPEVKPDRALGELSEEDIFGMKEEAYRRAETLGIPVEEAVGMVFRENGIRPSRRTVLIESIDDLEPDMKGISLRARIISIQKIERAEGGFFFRGFLGDSKGEVKYSCWTDLPYGANSALFLHNVSTRTWNGDLEVVINEGSAISPAEDPERLLPKIEDSIPSAISELSPGSRNVDVEVRVLSSKPITIESKGKVRDIVKGILADRTGRLDFTCWGPMDINEGACYRIIGGSVKEFRNVMHLNLSPGSIFKLLPEDKLPPAEELLKAENSRIVNLIEGRFSGPVHLRGTIVSVRPGSGLVNKCTRCGRRLSKNLCTVHGKDDGEWDLNFKGVFDDGSGTAFIKGDRTIVESILGRKMDGMVKEVQDSLRPEMISEEISDRITARPLSITADPYIDDYGLTLDLSDIKLGWSKELMEREVLSLMEVMI
ncbi:MAG: hypothetical protein ACMUIE_06275 [Thermoplasmatota archaeon]